jgi:hypothetical protein
MISVSRASLSNLPVADPASRAPGATRARTFRLGAPLVVLTAAALLLVGTANVEAARGREAVERQLHEAHASAARIPQQLATGNTEALAADLDALSRSSRQAQRGSGGLLWAVASGADPTGRSVNAPRHEARRIALLATAAEELRRSLTPLEPLDQDVPEPIAGTDAGTGGAITGADELDQLDDLARGLSRYAAAALRVDDPSAPALERAALAASLLPTLAGAEQPRTWTICRNRVGPCTRVTITSSRLGQLSKASGPPDSRGADLTLLGVGPDDVFAPAAGGQTRRWSARVLFGLLYRLGGPSITLSSVVAVEQHALDQLAAN